MYKPILSKFSMERTHVTHELLILVRKHTYIYIYSFKMTSAREFFIVLLEGDYHRIRFTLTMYCTTYKTKACMCRIIY